MLFRETLIGWLFSCIGYGDCGGPFWLVAANVGGCRGSGTHPFLIAGFPSHGCCIHTPSSASPPDIQGKSRMRKRARTDLCGGRSAMVVPTATYKKGRTRQIWSFLSYRQGGDAGIRAEICIGLDGTELRKIQQISE